MLEQLNFDVDLPLKIHPDSLGAKAIVENPVHHDRTKHIDIQHHYIVEQSSAIGSKDNTVDTNKILSA